MRARAACCAVFLLLAASSVALPLLAATTPFANEPVRVVETRSLTVPAVQASTHDLKLTLYAFKGTRWLPEDISAAALDALPRVAQCGVAVTSVELRILETPLKFHFYSGAVARELMRELARDTPVPRPAIFFVDETFSVPAYDAEAIGLGNAKTRPELANTIWFAYGAHDLPFAIAHELVHVLSDSGDHSDAQENLMQPVTAPENTRLTAEQCARLRTVAEANGLLARRTAPGVRK